VNEPAPLEDIDEQPRAVPEGDDEDDDSALLAAALQEGEEMDGKDRGT
jgi:hypothetical protein